MSNYRPISILPTLSKIFEKLLHKRIYNFLEHSNIIYDYQFGFRQGHSTIHAVQTARSSVITSLNSSYHSMGIFIDFSKAFDTIQHSILLKKLDHYGIRGVALDLIKDYLTNRKQYIFWDNNCSSSLMDITTGVPQGSVLGPLFFVIYVNDINCTGNSVKVIMSADDTNIFIFSRSLDDLYEQANEILLKLRRYINANYLHINLKKSKYMCFRSKRAKLSTHTLFYDNFQLEQVQTIKFLGVFISDTLTWDEHIKYLTRKLSRISGSLYKLVRCIPKDMIRYIYFALVNSQLIYGISIWGSGGSVSCLSSLFAAQKKSIRILFRVPRINKHCSGHTKNVFTEKKILSIHNLYFASMIQETFLGLHAVPPKPIVNII